MVAEDGRDRDRDTSEERPDFGDREEPVSPTDIVGAEAAGEAAEGAAGAAAEKEAAEKAAEEAASKAAEEEAARKAAEEAAGKAAEGPAVGETAESADTAEVVREEHRIEPRGPPYPKETDSSGREFTYQLIVKRRITGKKRPERPAEPEEPPKPRKEEEKEDKEEERSRDTAKGKGKKGKHKNPNWRPRSEEGQKYRRVKGLLKVLSKRGANVEDLPEGLQQLIQSFGPGGPSSGSGISRPAAKPRPVRKPASPVPEEEEEPQSIPEPDPAVVDQRKVTTGRLQEPERGVVSRVVERSRTKPEDKKPVFVTETAPQLTRPKRRRPAAEEQAPEKPATIIKLPKKKDLERAEAELRRAEAAREKQKEKEREEKKREKEKEEKKKEKEGEEKKEEKKAEDISAAAEESEYSYTYLTLSDPTTSEEEDKEVPKRD